MITLKDFNIYNYVHTDCLRPSGGASIFVKSSCPQRKIDIQTELQAFAASVTLDREISICSVYFSYLSTLGQVNATTPFSVYHIR